MDHGKAVRDQPRGHVEAEAGNHAEDGQHRRIRLAEDDRRPHDGDGDRGGQLPRRLLPGQFAPPIVRDRGRRIALAHAAARPIAGPAAASDETATSTGGVGCRAQVWATLRSPCSLTWKSCRR